jgi:hypothetical protein
VRRSLQQFGDLNCVQRRALQELDRRQPKGESRSSSAQSIRTRPTWQLSFPAASSGVG